MKQLKILFQGDSITDCGRSRENDENLGAGYPYFVNAYLGSVYSEKNIQVINRGISGNFTTHLVNRWEEDCVSLNPDIVSILIGINDVGNIIVNDITITLEQFEANIRKLLDSLSKETKIIILEPFLVPNLINDENKWRESLNPRINIIRKLSKEYNAILIKLDTIFNEERIIANPKYWSPDGVHPSMYGQVLIANEIIKSLIDNKVI